jgi:hydroxyacylglutathione hydrolase
MLLNNVVPIPAFTDNYIWAIMDEKQTCFDCVDPGQAEPVIDFAKMHGLTLRTILLTHHHDDHIGGVGTLMKAFPNCMVYGPNDSRIPHIKHLVKSKDIITVGDHTYHILSNPGHTSTHISYYEPSQGWLFCGDTLFSVGCGRVFDGTIEQLHESLLLFKKLPPSTSVFCAHEYTKQNIRFALSVEPNNKALQEYSNQLNTQQAPCSLPSPLRLECLINPFLRTDAPDVIQYALNHGALNKSSLEVFKILRHEKNLF